MSLITVPNSIAILIVSGHVFWLYNYVEYWVTQVIKLVHIIFSLIPVQFWKKKTDNWELLKSWGLCRYAVKRLLHWTCQKDYIFSAVFFKKNYCWWYITDRCFAEVCKELSLMVMLLKPTQVCIILYYINTWWK